MWWWRQQREQLWLSLKCPMLLLLPLQHGATVKLAARKDQLWQWVKQRVSQPSLFIRAQGPQILWQAISSTPALAKPPNFKGPRQQLSAG